MYDYTHLHLSHLQLHIEYDTHLQKVQVYLADAKKKRNNYTFNSARN